MSNSPDRRRSPRVEVIGKVRGRVVSLDVPIVVREMSLGGMSIESATAFEVGAVTDFMLMLGDGAGIEVYGRTIYTKPLEGTDEPRFLSGIQFVDQDEAASHPVSGIISNL